MAGPPIISPAINFLTNPVTSLTNTVTSLIPSSVFSTPPQYFFTVPFPNSQPALYQLVILDAGYNTVGEPYIFPLSPANINVQYNSMNNYFDVRGTAAQFGVQRIVDQYGITPPMLTINGTTGFPFHSLDGYKWSGRNSIQKLLQIVNNYTQLVQQAINGNQNLPFLLFNDGYNGIAYYVIPYGPQGFSMDNSRPLYGNYALQFIVVGNPQFSQKAPDPVAQAFVQTEAFLTGGLISAAANIANNITASLGIPTLS
jgi:hypothetical protein